MTTLEMDSDWNLVSLSVLPGWALGLCLGVIALACVLPFLSRLFVEGRAGSPTKAMVLFCLRSLGCLALAFLALEPGLRILGRRQNSPRVAVLVDTSASMNLPADEQGLSRKDAVLDLLGQKTSHLLRLSAVAQLELFAFADSPLRSLSWDHMDTWAFEGSGTDILGAIESAAASKPQRAPLAAVVLFSDGMDSTLAKSLSSEARKKLEALNVPVSTVLVGAKRLPDVAVDRVVADGFAFVRSPTSITAIIRATGFDGQRLPVTLKMDGKPYATQEITLPPSGSDGVSVAKVRFDFSPDQTGDFACTIEVPVLTQETVGENNAQPFSFKVIRDRVRILHVAGRPTWDMRFLRSRFSDSPNVDLVSSYILRDATDNPGTNSDSELALIPFPVQEIFREKLSTFDVVVIQNFSLKERAYAMEKYLPGIAQYVLDGGALVLMGGENSFGEGEYDQTPLGPLLPVEVTDRPPTSAPFQARLTNLGKKHPIMRVSLASSDASDAWKALPTMDGVHITRAKKDAMVLLEHPFETVAGENVPVVAVREAGQGRVMGIMSDASWQWAFDPDFGMRTFDRFWSLAVRWLVRDRDFSPVKIFLGTDMAQVGQGVTVRVQAFLPDYALAQGAQVLLQATPTDEAFEDASERPGLWSQKLRTDESGTCFAEFTPPTQGPWRLSAVGVDPKSGKTLGQDSKALAVLPSQGEEMGSLQVGERLLKEVAWVTKGQFFPSTEAFTEEIPLSVPPETSEEDTGKRKPLPHREWAFGLVCLSFFIQWVLLKRWGMGG